MISSKTQQYIKEKAEENNKIIPDNYLEILSFYCDLVNQYGYKLIFNGKRFQDKKGLNGNAGFFKYSYIDISPEWTYQLIFSDDSILHNAFLITLGHELTHKDINFHIISLKNLRFLSWIKEIYCDFGAAQKMVDSKRIKLIGAINFKKINSKEIPPNHLTHPTWDQRLEYCIFRLI